MRSSPAERLLLEQIQIIYGNQRVLEASTLAVASRGVTALLGRNGTGKSSVFRAVFGMYPDRNLSITVDGSFVRHPHLRPGLINYVPQRASHPPQLTVARYLKYYGLERERFLAEYPLFQSQADDRLETLSLGTARLLLCLIALGADTRYTVLDEPFSNVMPVHNELLLDALRKARARKGVLLSDHQYRTVLDVADTLYLIVDRRIRLLRDPGELTELGYLPDHFSPAPRR
ncbi:ATP-binding cassette domain-containing protein [Lewinella sp. IMCC34191]|uniref:ATP-binding cassette domain-containing protein n=1 Tax=Lewinella sp. IMCC34191 TaxID=2259172 RepID=UPI000E26708E|nr:ATP-binding cassette domain-containing protein [Lewinella sp. IMCC34191]